MMKDFTGTTYQEWLEYHRKESYPAIVKAHLESEKEMKRMVYGHIGKEKE